MTHRRGSHAHALRGSRHASLAEKPVEREEKVQVEVRKVDPLHQRRSKIRILLLAGIGSISANIMPHSSATLRISLISRTPHSEFRSRRERSNASLLSAVCRLYCLNGP